MSNQCNVSRTFKGDNINECRLLFTQFVSLALETIIPATNAPNADDNPKNAVIREKPKQKE